MLFTIEQTNSRSKKHDMTWSGYSIVALYYCHTRLKDQTVQEVIQWMQEIDLRHDPCVAV